MTQQQEFLSILDAELATPAYPTPRPHAGPAPLSFAQETLWFLDRLAPGLPTYHLPGCYRLRGPLDADALTAALAEVVRRHDTMRTYLTDERGAPAQIVVPEVPVEIPIVDVPDYTQALRLANRFSAQPFDLSSPPLWRAGLFRLGPEDHLFVIVVHHIIWDGWSHGVFAYELAALYRGATPDELAPLPIQYADYAHWQREWLTGERRDELVRYWRERLDGLPHMDFPTDLPRPAVQTFSGALELRHIDGEVVAAVSAFAARAGVTQYTVYLAAFFALLNRYTGQDDLVVGAPTMNREYAETEPLIGFFVNMLPVRADVSGDPTFRALVGHVWQRLRDADDHADLPFGQLVDAVRPVRDPARSPVFQIAFSSQNATAEYVRLAGTVLEREILHAGTSRFDMSWGLEERDGNVLIGVEYNTRLFETATIQQVITHYVQALKAGVTAPDRPLSRWCVLADHERRALVNDWQGPTREVPGLTIDGWFQRHATRDPDGVAVVVEGRETTYRALNTRANRIAHALADLGAAPERIVGVLLPRDERLVTAILGILKSGAAYLPLDPAHPPARLASIVGDANPVAVVTTASLAGLLPAGVPVLRLDADAALVASRPGVDPAASWPADRLAYALYTSGTTGRPKGVLIEHRAVVNFIGSVQELFDLTPADRVLGFTSVTYDVSVFEMFSALLTGARLYLATDDERLSIDHLGMLLADASITVLDMPPSVMALLEPERFDALRIAFVGGEAFPGELVNRWNKGRRFFNGYGPTECTVTMIVDECPGTWTTSPPIGLPMANHVAYVLDENLAPVPYGVVGELFIGGAGLARGYLNRPELTAERFIDDPFGTAPGGRVYRTGDLVRRQRDGRLVFVGRRDRQVKIRGLRMEPGEIEAVLGAASGIAQSAVEPWTDPRGEKHLVAYVVGADLDFGALRAFLARHLPSSMVPTYFVELPSLPLNTSGKVDRARLPEPAVADSMADAGTGPRTATERTLADEVVGPVLGIERVGLHDDFFALGGNSLQAAVLISRTRRRFGVDVGLAAFLRSPTVANLATLVDGAAVVSGDGPAAGAAGVAGNAAVAGAASGGSS